MLRAIDAFLIPFSLLWGGGVTWFLIEALTTGAPWPVLTFGVLFALIGLYFIFGRFLVDAYMRARTAYAVTSLRVVIVSRAFARQVKSLSIDTISDISLTERPNGSGFITFGPLPPYFWWYGYAAWPGFGYTGVPSFELAGGARQVYEILCKARWMAKQRA
jgi:hypothetical protein